MTTIVNSTQKGTCLYCGHTHILRWRTTAQKVEVFSASRRKYESTKNNILNHMQECEIKFYREVMEEKR